MGDILESIDVSELIEALDLWGESSVEAEDLIFYFCCHWQALEDIGEHFPDEISAVFFEALIVEAVELVDFPIFVVSAEDGDAAAMLDFEE